MILQNRNLDCFKFSWSWGIFKLLHFFFHLKFIKTIFTTKFFHHRIYSKLKGVRGRIWISTVTTSILPERLERKKIIILRVLNVSQQDLSSSHIETPYSWPLLHHLNSQNIMRITNMPLDSLIKRLKIILHNGKQLTKRQAVEQNWFLLFFISIM